MPNDVLLGKERKSDTVPPSRIFASHSSGPIAGPGQVDLGNVARHDRLGTEADSRQEHLHLLDARVLCFVEDDERFVQRSAAHECERRNLDDIAFDQPRDAIGSEHVVERVVHRPQIGIDFLRHVARAGTRGARRLRRPVARVRCDAPARSRAHRRRPQREIGLAGAGRPDTEREIVFGHTLHVGGLVGAARFDAFEACLDRESLGVIVFASVRRRRSRFRHRSLRIPARACARVRDRVARRSGHVEQRMQYVAAKLGSTGLAGNAKVIAAACDLDIEAAFDLPQVFIELAAEIGQTGIVGGLENDVPRNLDCIQDECFRPLINGLQQTTAMSGDFEVRGSRFLQAATWLPDDSAAFVAMSEFGSASVITTSTNWPISDGSPSKFTQRIVLGAARNLVAALLRQVFSTRTRCVVPTMDWLISNACWLIRACSICRRSFLTSSGVSSGRLAAGVPGGRCR